MNKLKLEYEMKVKGINATEMSSILGISRSAFYRKMNLDSEFTRNEIEMIIKTLDLQDPVGIFFADVVSQNDTK